MKKNSNGLTSAAYQQSLSTTRQLYKDFTPKPIGKRHFTVRLEKPHMPILLLYGFQTDCLHEHSLPFYYKKVYTND